MNVRTLNVKLEGAPEDLAKVQSALVSHKSVYNLVARHVFERRADKNVLAHKILHAQTYQKCRKAFPSVKAQISIKARQAVCSNCKTIKAALRAEGKRFRDIEKAPEMKGLAMRLDCRLYQYLPGNRIRLTTLDERVTLSFRPYPRLQEALDKWTPLDPLVFASKGQVWLAISFEIPCPLHVPALVTGVDLGLKRLATTSEGLAFQGNDFLAAKRRIRFNKRKLRRENRGKSDKDKRPFVLKSQSARKRAKRLRRKEQNYSRNYMHHLANAILTESKGNVLAMEDLSGMKFKANAKRAKKEGRPQDAKSRRFNNRNSQVPYYTLLQMMTYKAPPMGKSVETVDPRNTSKDDSTGGERGVRNGCRYFTKEGGQLDADHNAAVNIARRLAGHLKLPVSSVPAYAGSQTTRAGCLSTSRSFLVPARGPQDKPRGFNPSGS